MQDELALIEQEIARRQGKQVPIEQLAQPQQLSELDLIEQEIARREQEKANQPFYQPVLDTAVEAGQFIDKYTGAPTRTGLSTLVKGGDISQAVSAFGQQFGEDPTKAPTGKLIARQLGVSAQDSLADISPNLPEFLNPTADIDKQLREQGFTIGQPQAKLIEEGDPLDISKAGAVGLGIDIVADPLNLVPFAMIGKVGAKGVRAISKASRARKISKGRFVPLEGQKLAFKTAKAVSEPNTIIDIVKNAGVTTKKALDNYVNPKIADDFETLSDIAKRNNINIDILPEAVKYGESSSISRMARNIAEGPLGQQKLEDYAKAYNQVENALVDNIQSIGKGEILAAEDAGSLIKEAYNSGVSNFLNDMDITYNTVLKNNPAAKMMPEAIKSLNSKLKGVERFAKGRLKRGIGATQKSQARELLQAIDSIKKSNGSYKQTLEALRDIGEIAFNTSKSASELPSDIKKLREIYNNLNTGIIESVRNFAGDQVADQLILNNKMMSEFFNKNKAIKKIIENSNKTGYDVYRNILKTRDPSKIEALKEIIDPDTFQKIKSTYLNELVKYNKKGINFYATEKAFKSDKIIPHIFTPEEVKQIKEVLMLGNRMGEPILSMSGTGASNAFRDILQTVRSSVENEAVLNALKKRAKLPSPSTSRVPKALSKTVGVSPNRSVTPKSFMKSQSNTPKNIEKLGELLGSPKTRGLTQSLRVGTQER